jgi:3-oxoacyl-[acyl-carrier protein] reductase
MEIKGRKALLTGAAAGIGRATAVMLARHGAAQIVIADVNAAALASVAREIESAGAAAIAMPVDLSSADNVLQLFAEADRATGGLDIVHNNAGIMAGGPDFPDTIIAKMVAVMQINLIAMMVGTRIAIEQMRRRNAAGVIINTSSTAAFKSMPADPAYAASKRGILAFSESCKPMHERYNIRVIPLCPGITDTAIVPRAALWLQPALQSLKVMQPDQIAEVVRRIIEDDSLAGEPVIINNEPVQAG